MRFLQAKQLETERQQQNKALGGPPENKMAAGRSGGAGGGGGSAPAGPQASPQAQQFAREQGIDLANVKGTGADGLITVADVRKVVEEKGCGTGTSERID